MKVHVDVHVLSGAPRTEAPSTMTEATVRGGVLGRGVILEPAEAVPSVTEALGALCALVLLVRACAVSAPAAMTAWERL